MERRSRSRRTKRKRATSRPTKKSKRSTPNLGDPAKDPLSYDIRWNNFTTIASGYGHRRITLHRRHLRGASSADGHFSKYRFSTDHNCRRKRGGSIRPDAGFGYAADRGGDERNTRYPAYQ